MRQVTFLGTASAMPIASSSTALLLEDGVTNLLIDTSGGDSILGNFHRADKSVLALQQLFIGHADSDHVLGIVPLFRAFRQDPLARRRTLYCSQQVQDVVVTLLEKVVPWHYTDARDRLRFDVVADGDQRLVGNWKLTFFSLGSTKTPQLGFVAEFADGQKLAFAGDEPLSQPYEHYLMNCDVLIHEAFCTSSTMEQFKPHEKHHGTAKEAGADALRMNAGTLALFHMEDATLASRKQEYLSDVRASGYAGKVFVPHDGERLFF